MKPDPSEFSIAGGASRVVRVALVRDGERTDILMTLRPLEPPNADDCRIRFVNVCDVRFLDERVSVGGQVVLLLARDVSADGLEGIGYRVRDSEEEFISFACGTIEASETGEEMKRGWYEVWADETRAIPYVVLLRPTARGFEVVDPKEGDITVFEAATYEDAANWLSEDEFVRLVRTELVDDLAP
jgi:hypothetical protein